MILGRIVLLFFSALPSLASPFGKKDKSQVVLYWGQNSLAKDDSQLRLLEYCKQDIADTFIVAFVNDFGKAKDLSINLSNACGTTFPDSSLLHCPTVASDIKECQNLGKTVMLSFGGQIGEYQLLSAQEATKVADDIWNKFGNGKDSHRTFDDAVFDGFDFALLHEHPEFYDVLVRRLQEHFRSDKSKRYYISAAPQCAFPDKGSGKLLESAHVDFATVQFYNNPTCDITGEGFNWKTWQEWASTKAFNKKIKLLVGIPGGKSAASSGYIEPKELEKKISEIRRDRNFGGLTAWDSSQAFNNKIDGTTFAESLKRIAKE